MRALLPLLSLAFLVACDPSGITITDDVGTDGFELPGVKRLHTPYVPGLRVTVIVRGQGSDDASRWVASSSDDNVFTVDFTSSCGSACLEILTTAVGPGQAELTLAENDRVVTSRTIDVAVPDGLRLYPAPEIFQRGNFDGIAPVDLDEEIRVVEDSTATFLVAYFKGDGFELHGREALTPLPADGGFASAATSTLMPSHDWLQVRVEDTGVHDIELFTGAHLAKTLRVRGVRRSAVTRLELDGEFDLFASEGKPLEVVARGFDDDDQRVYGLDLSWEIGGGALGGTGDFVTYAKGDSVRVLLAESAEQEASLRISASSATVRSSNDLPQPGACACVTTKETPALAGLLVVVALGLVGCRRAAGTGRGHQDTKAPRHQG